MSEIEKNMDNYIKELLTINEDINKQLQAYKDKEDKLREKISSFDYMTKNDFGVSQMTKQLLQILNEGDK